MKKPATAYNPSTPPPGEERQREGKSWKLSLWVASLQTEQETPVSKWKVRLNTELVL